MIEARKCHVHTLFFLAFWNFRHLFKTCQKLTRAKRMASQRECEYNIGKEFVIFNFFLFFLHRVSLHWNAHIHLATLYPIFETDLDDILCDELNYIIAVTKFIRFAVYCRWDPLENVSFSTVISINFPFDIHTAFRGNTFTHLLDNFFHSCGH